MNSRIAGAICAFLLCLMPLLALAEPDEPLLEGESMPSVTEDASPVPADPDAATTTEAGPGDPQTPPPEAPAAAPETADTGQPAENPAPATEVRPKEPRAAPTEPPEPASGTALTDQPPEAEARTLTIASWGGAYGRAQQIALAAPFARETGIETDIVSHAGRLGALASEGRSPWDVVDLDSGSLAKACDDGLLEPLDVTRLAQADQGAETRNDFLPGAVHPCGVASVAWAAVIAYDRSAFKKTRPQAVKDLFDVRRYPGKRALSRDPKFTLEYALLADGVPPEEVYRDLATSVGQTRAFAMLDKIRKDVVWWRNGREPLELLADGKVVMAMAYNGRLFNAVVRRNAPLTILWDRQIYDVDMWAIPKSAANKKDALAFIAFATRPDRLAAQAHLIPYGPMRKSALSRIERHAEVNVDMTTFLPTAEANFQGALRLDSAWWDIHGAALRKKFDAWLEEGAEGAENDEGRAGTSD